MATKTNEIVIDALEYLIIQTEEAKIPQSEARAAVRIFNDLMFSLAAKGIELGHTVVTSLSDPVTIPLGAILGVKALLAVKLAPKYNVTPDANLMQLVKDEFETLIALTVNMASSSYPCTLPVGSGNYSGFADTNYYPDLLDTILTETGGSIALESDTEEA